MTTQAGPGDFFDVVNAWVVPTSSHIIHKLIENSLLLYRETLPFPLKFGLLTYQAAG